MRKHKPRKRFPLILAMAGALLFGKACSRLPEYKAYDRPKTVILHKYNKNYGTCRRIQVGANMEDFLYDRTRMTPTERFQGIDFSVARVLGEANHKFGKISKIDVNGKEFWTDQLFIDELNDENAVTFLGHHKLDEVPSELHAYVRERSNEQNFRQYAVDGLKSWQNKNLGSNLSNLAERDFIKWLSDYLIHKFNSTQHSEHEREDYMPLAAIATDASLSALVSDVQYHRTSERAVSYAQRVRKAIESPRHRKQIENYLASVATDHSENCGKRVEAARIVPDRDEFKEKSTYACSKCYEYCVDLNIGRDPWPLRHIERIPCKQDGYPCPCLLGETRVVLPEFR